MHMKKFIMKFFTSKSRELESNRRILKVIKFPTSEMKATKKKQKKQTKEKNARKQIQY